MDGLVRLLRPSAQVYLMFYFGYSLLANACPDVVQIDLRFTDQEKKKLLKMLYN